MAGKVGGRGGGRGGALRLKLAWELWEKFGFGPGVCLKWLGHATVGGGVLPGRGFFQPFWRGFKGGWGFFHSKGGGFTPKRGMRGGFLLRG